MTPTLVKQIARKNFYADLSYKSKIPDIEFAAWIHAEFVRIHPFPDGNGRTSRMIMNYQLMSDGWLPVSVPNSDRLAYFKTLEVYAVNGDIQPFAEFIAALENKRLDEMIEPIRQLSENQQYSEDKYSSDEDEADDDDYWEQGDD